MINIWDLVLEITSDSPLTYSVTPFIRHWRVLDKKDTNHTEIIIQICYLLAQSRFRSTGILQYLYIWGLHFSEGEKLKLTYITLQSTNYSEIQIKVGIQEYAVRLGKSNWMVLVRDFLNEIAPVPILFAFTKNLLNRALIRWPYWSALWWPIICIRCLVWYHGNVKITLHVSFRLSCKWKCSHKY